MNVQQLVTDLAGQGVELWTEGERLRYKAPKEVITPALLETLKSHKEALLDLLTHDHRDHPLSYGQRGIWFEQQLAPDSFAFNVSFVAKVHSVVNRPALQQAFQQLVNRHPALRTTFLNVDGQPQQRVARQRTVTLEHVDASAWPWERLIAEARLRHERPFDIANETLLRVTLLTQQPECHLLLITMHHLICDGWSIWMMLDELRTLYPAALHGKPAPLPPLKATYGDYVAWQQSMLQSDGAKLFNYWQAEVADADFFLNLPTDRLRPTVRTYRGASAAITLERPLRQQLRALAQQQEVTLYVLLLTAFQTLLHRYTGQRAILVGSPIAGRSRPDDENIFGYFTSPVVMRADFTGEATFAELLQQGRQTVLAALKHQDYPFSLLVEQLKLERNLNTSPIHQVAFALQQSQRNSDLIELMIPDPAQPERKLNLGGLLLSLVEIPQYEGQMDLFLELFQGADSIVGRLKYDPDLFDGATIERLLAHFQTLLAGIVADPHQRIADLPLLTLAEEQLILREWNNTATPFAHDQCIHQLFERWAAATPDLPAIVFEDGAPTASAPTLTYRQLNEQANQLAHALRRLGVGTTLGKETLVGIYLERSPALIVAILGILKAGGAYVPLDPAYPQERLAFLLHDTAAPLVISQAALATTLPTHSAQVVLLEEGFGAEPRTNLVGTAQPADLVYVIYTSGSTGDPNGVLIEHRSLCNSIESDIRTFAITPGSRVPHATSFNFDAGASYLFMTLCAGATLHLLPRDPATLHTNLVRVLTERQITHAIFPTAQLAALPALTLPHLRVVGNGGDVCAPEVVKRWGQGRRFFNIYGPTEATITTTIAECADTGRTPPIGRPIANLQIYLLDRAGNPVPIGVAGELHIGGVGLARGYLNRPAITARRFVAYPAPLRDALARCGIAVGEGAAARLYKTGDLARYLPDGNLEFLGRVDHQVKIRGYRIELAEIQAHLSKHPAVQECVVVATGEEGNKRIAAYFVPRPAAAPTVPQDVAPLYAEGAQEDGTYEDGAQEEDAHIAHWRQVNTQIFGETAPATDLTFNITGWRSSYTGLPLPASEMREWVEATVTTIRALKPQAILEIGCGTGLLVSRLAPEVTRYVGADLSIEALDNIRRLQASTPALAHVELLHQPADHFTGIAPASFDLVILNSVVQYFPSVDYLVRVLTGAVRALKPGGRIFIGDVRNYRLLEAFHAATQLAQAPATLTRAQLANRVQRAVQQEDELTLAPLFFHALRTQLPQIARVEIQLKRGHAVNELTQFRYTVVLQLDGGAATAEPDQAVAASTPLTLDWDEDQLTLATLAARLATSSADRVVVQRMPNQRVQAALHTVQWLATTSNAVVGDLRQPLPSTEAGVAPEALWQLAATLGYHAVITWSAAGEASGEEAGLIDLHLHRPGCAPVIELPPAVHLDKPLHHYANNPLYAKTAQQMVTDLRRFLQAHLPEQMIPAFLIPLPALPLTRIGSKVDLNALPAPESAERMAVERRTTPRTATERQLQAIWQQVLKVNDVGLDDNFFDLGGDSILSIQVITRANQADLPLTLTDLFAQQTIAALAAVADSAGASPTTAASQALSSGAAPVVPSQHWLLEKARAAPDQFNLAFLFVTPAEVDLPVLEMAVQELLRHHDILRMRLTHGVDGWQQHIEAPSADPQVTVVDLSTEPPAERVAAFEAAATRFQSTLKLATGELVRVVYFHWGDGQPNRLLFIAHHVIVDAHSLPILASDLQRAYQQLVAGAPVQLPPKSTSYQEWAEQQMAQWHACFAHEQAYWSAVLQGAHTAHPLPVDFPQPEQRTNTTEAILRDHCSEEMTQQLLQHDSKAYQSSMNDLLLTILVKSVAVWKGADGPTPVFLIHHGRQPTVGGDFAAAAAASFDLSRTVGLFAYAYPVLLEATGAPRQAIQAIQSQLRAVPQQGKGYLPLRYLGAVAELASEPELPVEFNFLGHYTPLPESAPDTPALFLARAKESYGALRSPRQAPVYPLSLICRVHQGRLELIWHYDSARFHATTIERLATIFQHMIATYRAAAPVEESAAALTTPVNAIPTPPAFPVRWAQSAEASRLWARDAIHWPEPITPLEFSLWEKAVEGMNRALVDLGLPPMARVCRVNSYLYEATALDLSSAQAVDTLVAQTAAAEARLRSTMTQLEQLWNSAWLPELEQHLAFWQAYALPQASLADLCLHLDETLVRHVRVWEIHQQIFYPLTLAMNLFTEFYQDLVGTEDALAALQLLAGLPNKTVESGHALWALSRRALAEPTVKAAIAQATADRLATSALLDELQQSAAGRAFLAEFNRYRQHFGQRGEKWGWRYPTWLEEPAPLFALLGQYMAQPDRDLAAETAEQQRQQAVRLAALRTAIGGYPQAMRDEFEQLFQAAQISTVLSEDHTYWIDFGAGAAVRRVMLEFGRRFTAAGVITAVDDIFYLTLTEIQNIATQLHEGRQAALDYQATVATRQAELRHYAAVTPPPLIGALPAETYGHDPRLQESAFLQAIGKFATRAPKSNQPTGGQAVGEAVLQGNAGASGRVEGVARVVHTLAEAHKLQPGEILVTETTAPPWTPLFAVAGAIVTESGGMLSHAAVVAREYRIPAVVGLHLATQRIRTGQYLEVDGQTGIVRLLPSNGRKLSV
jgi:amino acid adenylation domain-containing protein/non-ribosomal peptide synthase protein (TIGR01720 family)